MSTISNKKVHSFSMHKVVVFNFGELKFRKCFIISFSRDYACQGQKKKALKIKAFRGYIFFRALVMVAEVGFERPTRRNSRLGRVRVARFRRSFSPPLSRSLTLAPRAVALQAHDLPVGRVAHTSFLHPTQKGHLTVSSALCKGYKKDIFGGVLTGFELHELE